MKLLNYKLSISALALLALAGTAPETRAQTVYAAPYDFNGFAGVPSPNGVAVDSAGNLYSPGFGNNVIYKIDSAGNVAALAGNGTGAVVNGNGGAAEFYNPIAPAVDTAGNVYVLDYSGNTVRKIDTAGNVTTVAGNPGMPAGFANGNGSAALFHNPQGLAVDSAGNLYVGDAGNNTIRKIDTAGNVTTLAGSPPPTAAGSTDGNGSAALFDNPSGVALDSAGNLYVADELNYTIRKIDTAGNVTTIAGSPGAASSTDGKGSAALFNTPSAVTVDSAGNVYVADELNNTIRRIDAVGNVTTLAGVPGAYGSANGLGNGALFNLPDGIAVDSAGNLYVSEYSNNNITKGTVGAAQTLSFQYGSFYDFNNFAGYPGSDSYANGNGSAARFNALDGITIDRAGNLYVADFGNNVIRKIDSAANVTTLAGSTAGAVVNGNGTAAAFYNPIAPAVDSAGNIFVADYSGNTIRRIDTAANVTTLAGGSQGSADGQGSAAQFSTPDGVAVDSADNVYVSDYNNDTIRKIDTGGNVITWAGTAGNYGASDGQGSAASFYYPQGLAVDGAGNVYVADNGNDTIRKIDTAANVTTIAGIPDNPGYTDGPAGVGQFYHPTGVTVDSAGNIYVTDQDNNTIRKIDPKGNLTTIAGTPGVYGSANGFGGAAGFNLPDGIAVDSAGNLYVSEFSGSRVTKGLFIKAGLALSWPGPSTLQSSTNVTGPWTAIPGSTSPYLATLPGTNSQDFYRIW